MTNIIACIDGSSYTNSVCHLSTWAAKRQNASIALLHVIAPHSDVTVQNDLSGQIGLGAKSSLLQALTKMDEERGKLEQKKGDLILEHAKEEILSKGIKEVKILHRRGSMVDTIVELESTADLIVIGKRGENSEVATGHLGSNLERVARTTHKPLLVTTREQNTIERFLIAYDSSPSAEATINYAISNPLLKGLACHLLTVGNDNSQENLSQAQKKLTAAGFVVTTSLQQGHCVEEIISNYVVEHTIDLLVIGAYGHSKIRSLILGSTTTGLIRRSNIPLLLFREQI